jgi:hypothetical protein
MAVADKAKTSKRAQAEARQERLAAALRENLGKRKQQARARAAAEKSQPRGAVDTAGET